MLLLATNRRVAEVITAVQEAAGSKPRLSANAAAAAAERLETLFDAAPVQQLLDAYVAAAWAALGPSYLEVGATAGYL